MLERHDREQYFFDDPTIARLADALMPFELPCCLCAPTVGRELARRGREARILDLDERFADVPGFRTYDLTHPVWTGEHYGVILCDPPFFGISLHALHAAIRLLSGYDPSQPVVVGWLERREAALLRTFADFELRPTGVRASYVTVEPVERNAIAFYTNGSLAL